MKTFGVATLFLTLILLISPLVVINVARAQSPQPYYSVEPVATSPLTDVNSSVNGLETPATPSPVGQNFTVEIHLIGAIATVANVSGVEVHFYFGNILTYAVPTGFTDALGTTGGVLTGPQTKLLYGISAGFYDNASNSISDPPYTGATYYEVAAAATGKPWNGADGLVATITFQIIKQPLGSNGETTVNRPLACDFTDLTDPLASSISHDVVQGTLTIDATAAPPGAQYTLKVNVVGNGTVTENPSNATYASGTIVSLTATASSGWSFSVWTGDVTGTQNPVNVTMNGNKTVTATFTQLGVYYNLTVKVVGNGTVTQSPLNATYVSGTVVTLTAVAGFNWTFASWTGDLSGTQNPVNVTMDGNKNITATFVQGLQYYSLTINIAFVTNYTSYVQSGKLVENASVTTNLAASSYPAGTVVNLTEVPGLNWTFWGWSGDLTGKQNLTNVTMNANKNVTATFGLIWDLSHDGIVSLADLNVLANAWYATPNSPNWNPQCDFAAPFGIINLTDLVTLAINYSWLRA
ncbi:MAG TPA: hypothetical protein VMT42_03875 [candidate division Zixibacteria bacterium]|nr:hypothetical protein [candidate division Zixibacteria bacterium]